jgi:hypothetical protein
VVDGAITYQIGPKRKAYKAGGTWSAPAGTLIKEHNSTSRPARVFSNYLVAKGITP